MMGACAYDLTPTQSNRQIEERRAKVRFPMTRSVRYQRRSSKQENAGGIAKVIDISSSGALLETPDPFRIDEWLEIWIDWPALLDDRTRIQLVAQGRIVRVESNKIALAFGRHEFRICKNQLQFATPA